MKKKSPRKAQDTNKPAKKKSAAVGGLSLARLSLFPILVSVLVLLASGYAAYLQFTSQVSGREQEKDIAFAHELAAKLTGRLQAMSDELQHLAKADPVLLAAIADQDTSVLRQREAGLSKAYPEALRIRYILPTERDPEAGVTPRLSYACLDLARKAEAGKIPPLEVHLFGDKQQHLDMVRPVLIGNTPVASLMVTLDISLLKQWLHSMLPARGYVELLQGDGAEALPLVGIGESALKGQEPAYLAAVALSQWQVRYYPEHTLGMAAGQRIGFLATFAVAAAVLIAFFIFFNLYTSGLVRADLKRLVGFIVDSSLGKRFHSYPVKLAECKRVLQEKEMELSVLSSHANVKGQSSKNDVMPQYDQIPDLTFTGEQGIAVEEVAEGNSAEHEKP